MHGMAKASKLDCGVTLVTEKNDSIRSAALGIWVGSGPVYEDDGTHGISHFIEHMMFKGTENRTARQIAEDMDKIGASSNALTGKEATCYYIKTLSSNIYRGAEILLDMILNSRFDAEEMNKERQVILEEIKMVKDTPDDDVYDMVSELVNKGNPLGRSILGTPESLAGIDQELMKDYYSKRYAREGIVIAVAGNFDEAEITKIFEDKLLKLPEEQFAVKKDVKAYAPSHMTKIKDIEQTHICMAVPSVSYDDDLYYAYVLMNSIFGGSMSSRLFQNIREQKGLAYSVCSMNNFNSINGFFNIYAGVAHENAEKTVHEVKNELIELAEHGVTDEELAMAKQQVESSYIFSLENTTTMMFSIGRNKLLLDRLFSVDEQIEKFNAVTKNDIMKVAEMTGKLETYCGAAVTGVNLDLRELMCDEN